MSNTQLDPEGPTIWDKRCDMLGSELVEARVAAHHARVMYTFVGWPAAVLSALVSTTIFASEDLRVVAGCVAALVAVLTATNAFFNPQAEVAKAEQRAHGLKSLLLDVERTMGMGMRSHSKEWWSEQLARVDHRYQQITCESHLSWEPRQFQ